MNNVTVKDIADMLKSEDKITILCHTSPDEDTAGSAYALYLALQSIGKNVKMLAPSPLPKRAIKYIGAEYFSNDYSYEPSLTVSVDIASKELLGNLKSEYSDKVDICIDHHRISSPFAKYTLNRPEDTACAVAIYEIIKEICEITPDIASALYTAISSDSGGFRYGNTNSNAHRVASELIDAGADSIGITEALFEIKTAEALRAVRMGLENIRYIFHGKVALIVITNEDKRREGISDAELEEVAPIVCQTEGIILGAVLKQTDSDNRKFKVSLRSRGSIDCSEICRRLGGGGHERAAGAVLVAESVKEAEEMLIGTIISGLSK